MGNQLIEEFIEKIKLESTIQKCVKPDIIYQLINIFDRKFEKSRYHIKIINPLKVALMFYKHYNKQYYELILFGIKNNQIFINEKNKKSFVDTQDNKTIIKLNKNDGDIFILVHEFAHFIDRNKTPQIIPDKYSILVEVFSFYMEKQLELWLEKEEYKDLVYSRRNNRLYFESKMLRAIKFELYYENLYNKNGVIAKNDICISEIKTILSYDIPENIINYLLRYPLANILSDYLISNNLIGSDNEFYLECLKVDLYDALKRYSMNNKKRVSMSNRPNS